jgi:hypothetical protein
MGEAKMRFDRSLELVSSTFTSDDVGNQTAVEQRCRIFANELRINSTEYLTLSQDAGILSIKDARKFEVYAAEYQGEQHVECGEVRYTVIRVQPRGEKTWLTCRRAVSDG